MFDSCQTATEHFLQYTRFEAVYTDMFSLIVEKPQATSTFNKVNVDILNYLDILLVDVAKICYSVCKALLL